MSPTADAIAQAYVELALALDPHIPGYADACYGPPEWRERANAQGKRPLPELAHEAERLAAAIAASTELGSQRQDFLARQVHAMRTSLRLLAGEKLSFAA